MVASRFAIAESDNAATVRGKLEDGFVAAWEVTDDDPATARAAARLVGTWLDFDLGDLADVAEPPGCSTRCRCETAPPRRWPGTSPG